MIDSSGTTASLTMTSTRSADPLSTSDMPGPTGSESRERKSDRRRSQSIKRALFPLRAAIRARQSPIVVLPSWGSAEAITTHLAECPMATRMYKSETADPIIEYGSMSEWPPYLGIIPAAGMPIRRTASD
jgi:hypothetical protein